MLVDEAYVDVQSLESRSFSSAKLTGKALNTRMLIDHDTTSIY